MDTGNFLYLKCCRPLVQFQCDRYHLSAMIFFSNIFWNLRRKSSSSKVVYESLRTTYEFSGFYGEVEDLINFEMRILTK